MAKKTYKSAEFMQEYAKRSDSLDGSLIANINKGWAHHLDDKYDLVKMGVFFPKKIKRNPKIKFGLTAPWVKKTAVRSSIIGFDMEKRTLNVKASEFFSRSVHSDSTIDIEVAPHVTFIVSDVKKFYETIASKKKSGVITTKSSEFSSVVSLLNNALATLVKECKDDDLRNFNYFEIMKKIAVTKTEKKVAKNQDNQEVAENQNFPNTYSEKDKRLISIAKKITLIFTNIEEEYGIKIRDFNVSDFNYPKEFQEREEALSHQASENKAVIEKAKAEAEANEHKMRAETNKINMLSDTLINIGMSKEQISNILSNYVLVNSGNKVIYVKSDNTSNNANSLGLLSAYDQLQDNDVQEEHIKSSKR